MPIRPIPASRPVLRIEASAGADYRDREWNDTESVLPRASVSWHYQIQ